MMSEMPWVKLYTEFLDDCKIANLSDSAKLRFVQLILLAGECDAEGSLEESAGRPLSIEDIAWRLRIDAKKLNNEINDLQKANVISISDQTIIINNFSKRQGRPQSIKREQWRKRQQLHRDSTRSLIFDRSGGYCEYCKHEITYDAFIAEHIVPPFLGGSATDPNNLAASCRSCNTLKGDKLLSELGWENPRNSDKSNVTGDKSNVTPLEKRREEKRREEEEEEKEIEKNPAPTTSILPFLAKWTGKIVAIPSDQMDKVEQIACLREEYGDEVVGPVIQKEFKRWINTPRKDGKGNYKATNFGWVTWAQEALMAPPEKKFEDCVTVDEMIEWHNTHQA
jgi:5-methylcytosine-specific restriction endonuclease McrA